MPAEPMTVAELHRLRLWEPASARLWATIHDLAVRLAALEAGSLAHSAEHRELDAALDPLPEPKADERPKCHMCGRPAATVSDARILAAYPGLRCDQCQTMTLADPYTTNTAGPRCYYQLCEEPATMGCKLCPGDVMCQHHADLYHGSAAYPLTPQLDVDEDES